MKKTATMAMMAVAAAVAMAAETVTVGQREMAVGRQMYAEMQRVSGQVDMIQSNLDDLSQRVSRIEGGKGEIGAVRG